ncbi:hypothetical protein B296_00000810 [Ensete ventricosum]|uniref:Uncharacterized protein n=1 Tax=Ensete ventricosum TaxID=4639 RepID=A0A427A3U8_ENSVE|nr:hypothetical protein B296_00000810 [Ensete ventricosum]
MSGGKRRAERTTHRMNPLLAVLGAYWIAKTPIGNDRITAPSFLGDVSLDAHDQTYHEEETDGARVRGWSYGNGGGGEAGPGGSEGDEVGEETGGLEVGDGDGGRDEEKRWTGYASHHHDQLLPLLVVPKHVVDEVEWPRLIELEHKITSIKLLD